MALPKPQAGGEAHRPRPQDADRHIGARLRARRLSLGLTQQGLAELIGVTYQQAHKYEKGVNRIAGGRLYTIAQALGVEVGFFYDGIGAEPGAFAPTAQAAAAARAEPQLRRHHQPAAAGSAVQPGPRARRLRAAGRPASLRHLPRPKPSAR